jgi:ATP-dependent helicase/nuclease subunit A
VPESYLDTDLSIIISSPAGSGKTEKLARRFISLMDSGTDVERILCITFTEKAAAEMKERILSILERERPELLQSLRDKIPYMRITTIHAFCLKILKRFSIELGLDPSLEIMDEQTARDLWSESVYESLMDEGSSSEPFFEAIRQRGLKGWQTIKRALEEIHKNSPVPELALRQPQEELSKMSPQAATMLALYSTCLARYRQKKKDLHLLDFNDLELLAHEALSLGPDAHNILYSFDEHTDHLLVDEFQDTSTLQWKIIDKLTEEWRSGLGAKRSKGIMPTIFLVGDEKQSIYLFRGANVSVFREAGDKLNKWMEGQYRFLEVQENYRSLRAITNFTNALFERIMLPESTESWKTRYSPFKHTREGDGKVELLLFKGEDSIKNTRQKEAGLIARRIQELVGVLEINDNDKLRVCQYEDMGILIRKRTHLALIESELNSAGVPFVVLKGIGFFDEPEIAILRETISFLTDPGDRHAFFCMLRSPLFRYNYHELSSLLLKDDLPIDALENSEKEKDIETFKTIQALAQDIISMPLSVVLENLLVTTGAWGHFSEPQRHANIKKFLNIIEAYQSEGLSILDVRERLIRQRSSTDVSKANVNAEGMNAVRIMTIHAAKGLQFPIVFLPAMDEKTASSSGPVVFTEEDELFLLHYEEDSSQRNKLEAFRVQKLKQEEEQKRLFYVAITRAMDFLCMSGAIPLKKAVGRLQYLDDAFDIFSKGYTDTLPFSILNYDHELLGTDEARAKITSTHIAKQISDEFINTSPLEHETALTWAGVTDDTVHIRKNHGSDWVLTGTLIHQVLEDISEGAVNVDTALEHARKLVIASTTDPDRQKEIAKRIEHSLHKLSESGLMEKVVTGPNESAYTELPFTLEIGRYAYNGRIDRVIIQDNTAYVYDYKSFPVKPEEEEALIQQYGKQMSRYKRAVENLFGYKTKAYLVLTNEGRIVEV